MMKKNKNVGTDRNTSSFSKADIISDFHASKKQYLDALNRNMSQYLNGKIDDDEYLFKQRDVISEYFSHGFLLGKKYTQNTEDEISPDEKKSIAYQVGKEMRFMEKFANDIKNQSGRMPYKRRMKMYAEGITAMFLFGQMAYLPNDVDIYWVLGDTDKHCVDCLSIASNSPYKKKNLPTVPKACGTRCLSNCLCSLKYPELDEDGYLSFVLNNYSNTGKKIPTKNQYLTIKDYRNRFYNRRGLGHIFNSTLLLKNAKNIKSEYFDYIRSNNFAIKKELLVSGFIKEINMFKKNKMFIIQSDTGNLINKIVSIHNDEGQKYARVLKIFDNYRMLVVDISGQSFEIDINKSIVFMEKD